MTLATNQFKTHWDKMGTEATRGRPEFWPRQLVKKWLNLRQTSNLKFHRDTDMDAKYNAEGDGELEEREDEFDVDISNLHASVDLNSVTVPLPSNPVSLLRGHSETLRQQFIDKHEYRIAVHTWNVAGKPPPDDLDLEEWIGDSQPADIYVFGFQEIVPLNANNVLCVEDQEPAARWEGRIREFLNNNIEIRKERYPFQSRSAPGSPCNNGMRISISEDSDAEKLLGRCVSGKNLETTFLATEGNLLEAENWPFERTSSDGEVFDDGTWLLATETSDVTTRDLHEAAKADELLLEKANLVAPLLLPTGSAGYIAAGVQHRYSCVASKQMVGIFITVWVRSQLWRHVHNVKVSAVGLGLMRYLGNKGSISVSMCLHHTSFCFVCSHLTPGDKDGDQFRRNADIMEILRRTKFPRLVKVFGVELPANILAHDRVIWLGDLNYRIALSDKETWRYVICGDWEALLRNDQLKLEHSEERVFKDWQEGQIYFPPTYKYKEGTDRFSGETSSTGEKRRSPAWCDRILWYGKGMKQVAYTSGDLKLSDHRSVCATFIAEVEVVNPRKLKKACFYPKNITVGQLKAKEDKMTSNELQRKRSQNSENSQEQVDLCTQNRSFQVLEFGDETNPGVMIDWEEYLEFPCAAAVEKLLYLLTSCYSMLERTHLCSLRYTSSHMRLTMMCTIVIMT